MKNSLLKRPGILLATIGVLMMIICFAVKSLTGLEKAVMFIICAITIIGGTLSETKVFDKFKEGQEESPDWW